MKLEVTLVRGGIREFERTGIYPQYLLINLPGTRQSWRIRIKQTPQKGVLKSNGQVHYQYSFDVDAWKFRKVKGDGSFSEWMEPERISIVMSD